MDAATAELAEQIRDFFKSRMQTHEAVNSRGKLSNLFHTEDRRADEMSSFAHHTDIKLLNEPPLDSVTAKIYRVSYYYPSAGDEVVLAFYEDGTILWLDDHSDNHDFEAFLRREQIQFQDALAAARFIATLKFNYLFVSFRWKVIETAAELADDEKRQYFVELGKQGKEALEEYDARLAAIVPRFHSPVLKTEDGRQSIAFYLWSSAFGPLFYIRCQTEQNYTFTWEGERVATGIGDYFAPR